ncbi:MAG: signal peptidase I [Actinomycetota bacterium]
MRIAQVDTPTEPNIPQWVTLREASLITGEPQESLLRSAESGLVSSDPVLSRRLGPGFLLLNTDDLSRAGMLRRVRLPEDQVAVVEPPAPAPPQEAGDLSAMPLPEWVTLREAAFITGLDDQSLQRQAESGLIASHSLSRRRGSGFLLLRSSDLARATRLHQEVEVEPARAPEAVPLLMAQPAETAQTVGPVRRWGVRAALWALLGICSVLLLLVSVPLAFGYHTTAVRSGDMEPAFRRGDLVIAKTVSPGSVRRGDVVTFRDPADPDRLTIQRVEKVDASGGTVRFTTKADGSEAAQGWSVPSDGRVGLVAHRVGLLGHILTFVQTKLGQVVFIVVPMLALGVLLLIRTWQRPREQAEPGRATP